jgi:hypothetical protein
MINITTKLANKDVVKRFLEAMPHKFNEVIAVSLNKAAALISKESKKAIPKLWGVQKEKIKESKINKASAKKGNMMAEVLLGSQSIPLLKFNNVTANNKGVNVNILGSIKQFTAGTSVVKKVPKEVGGAFIAKFKSGHTSIFRRIKGEKSRSGMPRLNELKIIGSYGMGKSKKTNIPQQMQEAGQRVFEQTFEKECEAWLMAMGAK